MTYSPNWLRHAALSYLNTLLGELVTSGDIDQVTIDPTSLEFNDSKRVVYIRPGEDDHSVSGIPGDDVSIEAVIYIRCWGSVTSSEGLSLSLETILAKVRDKINTGITASDGFKSLDPAVQVEGFSVVDDPAFSSERDLSGATLALRISNHG